MIEIEKRERIVHLRLDAPPVNVLDSKLLGELTCALREVQAAASLAACLRSCQQPSSSSSHTGDRDNA